MTACESEIGQAKEAAPSALWKGSPKLWAGLGLLTLAASILCLSGLAFGLPHDSRPDEIPNIQVAFTVLQDIVGQGHNALNPKSFNYGSLYYYILTACYWVYFSMGQLSATTISNPNQWFDFQGFVFAYQTNPTVCHVIIRTVSAVSAILLTPLIFFTARQWQSGSKPFNDRLPWIAAILTAGCYLIVRNAHFGSPDTLMTLGILASLLMIWRFQEKPDDAKRLQWAGISIGLAASIKIPAILMLIPLAWACLAPHWHQASDTIHWKAAGKLFTSGLGWALLAFAVTSPWMILDIPGVIQWFSYEGAFYGFTLPGLPVGWQFYPTFALPIGLGFLTFAFSLFGIALLLHESKQAQTDPLKRAKNITLFLSVIVFCLFLGPNLRIMTRYALPLLPLLLLTASHAGYWLITKLSGRISTPLKQPTVTTALFCVVLGFLMAEPLSDIIQWDKLLLQGDTRQMAADWILRNVPERTAVATGPRLGQIRLPVTYGQLLLETGPNNLRPPEKPSMQRVTDQTQLINTYDVAVLKQLGIRYVVLYGSNLLFSSPNWEIQRYFQQLHLQPVFHVSPLKPKTEALVSRPPSAIHDPLDALFIPYAGFQDSAYTGPEIFIFDLAQVSLQPPLKNPGNPG